MSKAPQLTAAPLGAAWRRIAQRVDALSLRERAVLFVSIALVMLALLDQFALSPTLIEQRQRKEKLRLESDELGRLRAQLSASGANSGSAAATASPEARWHVAITQASARKLALDQQVAQGQAALGTPVRLPDLLERSLQRHARLTLVSLASRGDAPTSSPAANESLAPVMSAATSAAPAPPSVAGVTWQGADLSVSGDYPDLTRFVVALEQGLPGLRWGDLHLSTDHSQPVLSLHLWLAGGPAP